MYKKLSQDEIDNKENGVLTRKTLLQDAIKKQIEKFKRNLSDKTNEFLKKLFHVKIDWKKVLRNSLQTALAKEEYYSWSRPRTSLFALPNSPYLPSATDDNSAYGTLIVARDESGSMSDAECAKAAGIIADAKNYYKKIIVLKIPIYKESTKRNLQNLQKLLKKSMELIRSFRLKWNPMQILRSTMKSMLLGIGGMESLRSVK